MPGDCFKPAQFHREYYPRLGKGKKTVLSPRWAGGEKCDRFCFLFFPFFFLHSFILRVNLFQVLQRGYFLLSERGLIFFFLAFPQDPVLFKNLLPNLKLLISIRPEPDKTWIPSRFRHLTRNPSFSFLLSLFSDLKSQIFFCGLCFLSELRLFALFVKRTFLL